MSKILIFQSPEIIKESIDIDEKKVIFNNLKNELQNKIEDYHFNHFQNLENEYLFSNKNISKGISSLLAKELIKYLTPLVIEIPESSHKKGLSQNIFKNVRMIRTQEKNKIKKDYTGKWFISLQNEFDFSAILFPIIDNKRNENIKYKKIQIPKNTIYRMIGFVLPDFLGVSYLDSSIFIKSIIDDISISNYNNLKKTGSFKKYSTSTTNYSNNNIVFIQQFDGFEHIKNNISKLNINKIEKFNYIKFNNDKDALNGMNLILNEIKRIQLYYIDNYISIFKTLEFDPLQNLNIYIKKKEKDNYKSKNNISNKNNIFNKNTLEIIKKLIPNELIGLEDNKSSIKVKDYIYNSLKSNELLELYDKISILGIKDEKIQQEINDFLNKNEINKILEIQKKIRDNYLIKLIKKQALTINKFGKDNIYDNLSKNKKNIIDKEYNILIKQEKIKEKNNIIKIKYKLISKFYNSFNTIYPRISLKNSLSELKKNGFNIDKSSLNYGLCEHNLTKAKLIIKGDSFKKIRDFMINKYTQETNNDFYCNICGERIYINYVDRDMEFIKSKIIIMHEDDTLGDLIFKEVSNIIRNYVRFKVEMNIFPIIK